MAGLALFATIPAPATFSPMFTPYGPLEPTGWPGGHTRSQDVGRAGIKNHRRKDASNRLSYTIIALILQFGGAILYAIRLDLLGLGPAKGIYLRLILLRAVLWHDIKLGMW